MKTRVLGRVSADLVCTLSQKPVKIAVPTKDRTFLMEWCMEWSPTETFFGKMYTEKTSLPIVTIFRVVSDFGLLACFLIQI